MNWAEERREWNKNNQCAREACRGDLSERRFYNIGSHLFYCRSCAQLINHHNFSGKPLCWEVCPPGHYEAPDGVQGELSAFDSFHERYIFFPDPWQDPAPGVRDPRKWPSLEEALTYKKLEIVRPPPPVGEGVEALLQWRKKVIAAEKGPLFLGLPDRWFEEGPFFRCTEGHVSSQVLKTEEKGNLCLACRSPIMLTFPEDKEVST